VRGAEEFNLVGPVCALALVAVFLIFGIIYRGRWLIGPVVLTIAIAIAGAVAGESLWFRLGIPLMSLSLLIQFLLIYFSLGSRADSDSRW
jgi:hypothetical protein